MTIGNSLWEVILVVVLVVGARLPAAAGASQESSTLTSCLSSAKLNPVSVSSPDYKADSLAFNRRLSYKPADIVFPTSAQDVASAVTCASQAGIKVAARSGGHSYAANGIGGEDGSLVVDLRRLNTVKVTAGTQTAQFWAGTRLGDLALALFNGGKQAMAHGNALNLAVKFKYTRLIS
jgi:hypothetical protein